MANGWIKLHRQIIEKGFYKKSAYIHLWIHLLLLASHKQKEYMSNDKMVFLKEGQFVTGRKQLSEATGISETTVERILKMLETEQQIEQQKTTKYRVITIVKWVTYQKEDSTLDNKRTTNGQQTDTIKKDKNNKKEKNTIQSELSSQGIAEIFKIFSEINPTIKYNNTTQRKAIDDLIKQFGKEKVLEYATYAISVFGKPYAPTITTPYELREKLSKLAAFHTSEKNKKEKVTVTKTF